MYKILTIILLSTSLFAEGDAIDTLRIKTEADSLFIIADSLMDASQHDEAVELFQIALKKYQQISDRAEEANTFINVGVAYYSQGKGNVEKALLYWENALTIHKKLGNREDEGKILGYMGELYNQAYSDFPKALELQEKRLEIVIELGDLFGQGETYHAMGNVYDYLGNNIKSLEFYEKALNIFIEIGDRKKESDNLDSIGAIHYQLSDFKTALDYYNKSLDIKNEIIGPKGDHATLFYHFGQTYIGLDNYSEALKYYEKALEEYKMIDDKGGESSVLNEIGRIYQEKGDYVGGDLKNYEKALEYYEKALAITEKYEPHNLRSKLVDISNIGLMYGTLGKFTKAEEVLKKALAIANEIGGVSKIAQLYNFFGWLYGVQGLDSLSAENYILSIETVENIRSTLITEGQRTSYYASEQITYAYDKVVYHLLEINRKEDAFNYVERSRARSFLDLLASTDVKVGKSRHEEFLNKKEKFQEKEEEIGKELIVAEEDTVLYAELRGKLDEQRGLMIRKLEENKKYEPELASLVTINSLTLPQVQALLDKETVLEYFLRKQHPPLIFLITKDDVEVYQVDIGSDSLKVVVKNFLSSIKNLSDSEEQSSKLYDLLIKPAISKIETEELVIIPHGILHYLPFQALQDEKGKYLLEKHQISYLPSASVMKYIIPKKRDKGKTILALGNPKLNKTSFAPIPFAEQEVKAIAKLFSKSKVLIGAEATEEKFRQLAPDYDILHLACHAELNPDYPLYSGLLLSSSEEQDGELDVHELFTMDLNASLVVLSACQTGLGKLTKGDELVGLSRAFIYAGTPSVISSLWMVEDESTSYLMEQFYNNLKKYNKAESLQKAQLQTKKKYKNLRSWASFVLVGDS